MATDVTMPNHSFPRSVRLLNGKEFSFVFDAAQFKAGNDCLLLLGRSNGRDQARIGFVISKRNVRRAVNRNLIRRIVRESFRRLRQELPPIDVVVMTRKIDGKPNPDVVAARCRDAFDRIRRQAAKAGKLPSRDAAPAAESLIHGTDEGMR